MSWLAYQQFIDLVFAINSFIDNVYPIYAILGGYQQHAMSIMVHNSQKQLIVLVQRVMKSLYAIYTYPEVGLVNGKGGNFEMQLFEKSTKIALSNHRKNIQLTFLFQACYIFYGQIAQTLRYVSFRPFALNRDSYLFSIMAKTGRT